MAKETGKIIQIVGVVIDAEFEGDVPAIYEALEVKHGDKVVTLEVAQHLDEHTVRAVSLQSTDGLQRGQVKHGVEADEAPEHHGLQRYHPGQRG